MKSTTISQTPLNVAMNSIDYSPEQHSFGTSSDELTHDQFSRILSTYKNSDDSNFFQESAKQINDVLASLNSEQLRLVIRGEVELFEMVRARKFELSLQSSLKEKPITTRNLKI